MCVEAHTERPLHSCRNMYLWYILLLLLSSTILIFHLKWNIIGDVVGFAATTGAGEGILTHLLCVSLVSFLMGNWSKTCLFEVGQHHLALLTSPQGEAYEQLFGDLLV